MTAPFWDRDPDAPFATLLSTLESYVNPEADTKFPLLQEAARYSDQGGEGASMRVFKEELRAVVRDPSVLPEGALFEAVAYEDGSDRKFLERLWRELYGGEAV
ncbi:MAG TPA: hypothetical protein VGL93_16145 [Streptosporangiaceae bacterium]